MTDSTLMVIALAAPLQTPHPPTLLDPLMIARHARPSLSKAATGNKKKSVVVVVSAFGCARLARPAVVIAHFHS